MRDFKTLSKDAKPRRSHSLATLVVRAPLRALAVVVLTVLVLAGFVVRAYNRPASPGNAASRTVDPRIRPTSLASATGAATSPPNTASSPANMPSSGAVGAYRAVQTGQVDKRGFHTVTFGLYDVGIEPSVIHTRKGLVAIQIEDRSPGTSGLLVQRETGSGRVDLGCVQRFGPAAQSGWRGRSEFDLEPGTYRVTDSSRPQNFAQLIVEP